MHVHNFCIDTLVSTTSAAIGLQLGEKKALHLSSRTDCYKAPTQTLQVPKVLRPSMQSAVTLHQHHSMWCCNTNPLAPLNSQQYSTTQHEAKCTTMHPQGMPLHCTATAVCAHLLSCPVLPLSNMQHEHTANPDRGCYILAVTRPYALLQHTHHQYAKHARGLCQGHLAAYVCLYAVVACLGPDVRVVTKVTPHPTSAAPECCRPAVLSHMASVMQLQLPTIQPQQEGCCCSAKHK
jgi:hypothetical protein